MGGLTPTGGTPEPTAAAERLAEARDAGGLPDWVAHHADPGVRDALVRQLGGTKDIAGAAEALCAEGMITYDQAEARDVHALVEGAGLPTGIDTDRLREIEDAEAAAAAAGGDADSTPSGMPVYPYVGLVADSYIAMAEGDSWRYATRGNCFDFVHLAARVAAPDGARRHSGNGIAGAIDPSTLEEWDYSSPIPRGKVIVGCAAGLVGGQGSDGTYHFAVSLGDGKVANNRGTGVREETLHSVFGGWFTVYRLPGGRVLFGDYACYAPKSEDAVTAGEVEGNPKNPKSAAEMRGVAAKIGVAAVGLVALGGVALAVTSGGDDGDAAGSGSSEDVATDGAGEAGDAEPSPPPDVLVRYDADRDVFVVGIRPEGEFGIVDPLEARGAPQGWQVAQGFVNGGQHWAVVYFAPGPECPAVNGEIDVLEADGRHGFGVQFVWGAPQATPRHYREPVVLPAWGEATGVTAPCTWGALVSAAHLAGVDEMHAWVAPDADNSRSAIFTQPVVLDTREPVLTTQRFFAGGGEMVDAFAALGAFFTTVGYEIEAAPAAFFYAHAVTPADLEPFTVPGASEGAGP